MSAQLFCIFLPHIYLRHISFPPFFKQRLENQTPYIRIFFCRVLSKDQKSHKYRLCNGTEQHVCATDRCEQTSSENSTTKPKLESKDTQKYKILHLKSLYFTSSRNYRNPSSHYQACTLSTNYTAIKLPRSVFF